MPIPYQEYLRELPGFLTGVTATVINYTSTADNDIPSVAMRTHVYTTVTDCNYILVALKPMWHDLQPAVCCSCSWP